MTSIADAVAAASIGVPSARKTGRNPRWPYVPVLVSEDGHRTRQLKGMAFATRDEAVAYAAHHVRRWKDKLAHDLAQPQNRGLRRFYGVTEEARGHG